MPVTPEQKEQAIAALAKMISLLGLRAEVRDASHDDLTVLSVHTETPGRLIGRKGQYLESLELLLNRIVKKKAEDFPGIAIDIDGYQKRSGSPHEAREREAREGEPREGEPREGERREREPRERGPRDRGPRDRGPRDQGPRDRGPRDQGPRDQGPRDQGPRDQGQRDQGPRDQGPRDQVPRDQGQRDQGQRDSAPQDQEPRAPAPPDQEPLAPAPQVQRPAPERDEPLAPEVERMALDVAKEVRLWGEPKAMGPYPAGVRRAIQLVLRSVPQVAAESGPDEGNDLKKVIIKLVTPGKPAGAGEASAAEGGAGEAKP